MISDDLSMLPKVFSYKKKGREFEILMMRSSIYSSNDCVLRLSLHLPTGKSFMTLLTMAKFEWFEDWKDTELNKRGFDYEELKMSMAKELLDWALVVFPQLRDKVL